MNISERNNRIRLLVKRVNQQRKKQAKQIDLLCRNIIAAHHDFINTVKTLAFSAELNESLIGIHDLDRLFYTCANAFTGHIPDTNFVFFLTGTDNFQMYAFDCNQHSSEHQRLEQHFNKELVRAITKSNKSCNLHDMLQMGLQVKPSVLKHISAATVPIAEDGSAEGFILIYRTDNQAFTPNQIKMLCSARTALTKAISTCTITQ